MWPGLTDSDEIEHKLERGRNVLHGGGRQRARELGQRNRSSAASHSAQRASVGGRSIVRDSVAFWGGALPAQAGCGGLELCEDDVQT